MKANKQILILGIGNTIRGDDGVGIYLARKLRGILPRRFEIRESAAGGFDLLEAIYGYDKVILIDAIQTANAEPGQVYHFLLQDFQGSLRLSCSHSLGLSQVMEVGKKLMGESMPEVEVLAVEARRLNDFSETLSPELEEQFDDLVETVRAEIDKEN